MYYIEKLGVFIYKKGYILDFVFNNILFTNIVVYFSLYISLDYAFFFIIIFSKNTVLLKTLVFRVFNNNINLFKNVIFCKFNIFLDLEFLSLKEKFV